MDEMSKVWKKKEYLRDCTDIPVKMGRGRLSGVHHEALNAAKSRGVRFSDFGGTETEVVKVKSKEGDETKVKVIRSETPTQPGDSRYLTSDEYRFPEAEYKAVTEDGKKTFGMREVCSPCGVSMVNHACANPRVLGDIRVQIVKR